MTTGRESDALASVAAFRAVQASDVLELLGDENGERSAQKSLDKREYQQFLQEQNSGRAGRRRRLRVGQRITTWPARTPTSASRMRVEFEDRDGLEQHRDIEVVTAHYGGAHAAAVAGSGFQNYSGGLSTHQEVSESGWEAGIRTRSEARV